MRSRGEVTSTGYQFAEAQSAESAHDTFTPARRNIEWPHSGV